MTTELMTQERIEGAELEKMDEAQLEQTIAMLRWRMPDKEHVHCTCRRCLQRNHLAIVKHVVNELGLTNDTASERLQKIADTLLDENFWVRQGRTSEERARQQALKQTCRMALHLLEEKRTHALKSGLTKIAGDLPDGTKLDAVLDGRICDARVAGIVSHGKLIEAERQRPEESEVPF